MNSEQLRKFCSKNDPRTYLLNPIRRDGSLYATNGHIMVCIPDNPEIEATESDIPNFGKFKETVNEKEFSAFVAPDMPEPTKCTCCTNGKVNKCPDCDGDGSFEHGDFEYECKNCDESGFVDVNYGESGDMDCPECHGTGYDQFDTAKIGSSHFATKYIRMLIELSDVQIWTDSEKQNSTAFFKFDGGWGAIMPCRPRN